MKHISKIFTTTEYHSHPFDFYFGDTHLAVFDIETTGLSPSGSSMILAGLFIPVSESQSEMHQYFAQSLEEEPQILEALMKHLEDIDVVITYNGRHFDIPFVKKRLAAYGLSGKLPYNMDLYQVLRKHSDVKKFLPNLKQKTVENYMGMWKSRTDEISGGESVELYYKYLQNKNKELENRILLHNSDDVAQLYGLLNILEQSDLHGAMFSSGFPIKINDELLLSVDHISLSKNNISVEGTQRGKTAGLSVYNRDDIPYDIVMDNFSETFHLELPIIQKEDLKVADLEGLDLPETPFERFPGYQNGFLLLSVNDKHNTMEINCLVKNVLERIMNKWII